MTGDVVLCADRGLHVPGKPAVSLHSPVADSQDDATSLWRQLAEAVSLLQPLVQSDAALQVWPEEFVLWPEIVAGEVKVVHSRYRG